MKRVHRNLPADKVDALRESVASLVPDVQADIADLIKTMRLATRLSQREYATLCGISLAALQQVESGKSPDSFRIKTLEKLLRPFGYRIGVVRAQGRKIIFTTTLPHPPDEGFVQGPTLGSSRS